jgi:hypothetical protein
VNKEEPTDDFNSQGSLPVGRTLAWSFGKAAGFGIPMSSLEENACV